MSLPRFVLSDSVVPHENLVMPLSHEQAKHVSALRLTPGGALEILVSSGLWLAELMDFTKHSASIRFVGPIDENREPPVEIQACLPITAQLSLWDDFLPGAVELGVTLIQPIIYERSQYNKRKVDLRVGRWRKIILSACEQSHRTKVPELLSPVPVESLQSWETEQRWAAYEVKTEDPNPRLVFGDIAFTHGPEGGISDTEIEMLRKSGWKPISLGKSILRAATCPIAILGAIRVELGRL